MALARRFRLAAILFSYVSLNLAVEAQSTARAQLEIDWSSARAQMQADRQRLSEFPRVRSAAVNADEVDLPVLVVGQGLTRSASQFAHQNSSYAAYYSIGDGDTLSIMGTAVATQLEDEASLPAQQNDTEFTQSEDGADLSFSRFGAVYTLRVTCGDLSSERCTSPEYLQTVASSLIVAGGRGI